MRIAVAKHIFSLTAFTGILLIITKIAFAEVTKEGDRKVFALQGLTPENACRDAEESILYDGEGRKIYFPYFLASNTVAKRDTCSKLIRQMSMPERAKGKVYAIQRITQSQVEAFHVLSYENVYTFADSGLHRHCIELGLCRDLLPALSFMQDLHLCNSVFSFSKYLDYLKPRLRRAAVEVIPKLKLIESNHSSFAEYINERLRSMSGDTAYISTMNMGNFSGAQLNQVVKATGKHAFITADAKVMFSQLEPDLLKEFLENPGFNLLPMIANDEFSGFHHWKFFVERSDSDLSALTSMNIADPKKTRFKDLLYEFGDSNIANQFRSLFQDAFYKQCESLEDLRCYLEFVFEDSAIRELWLSLARKSCRQFAESGAAESAFRASYLVNSAEKDLLRFVLDFIEGAEKEVTLISHQLNHVAVLEALKKARKRGLEINLITNEEVEGLDKHLFSLVINNQSHPVRSEFRLPHMKVILADRKTMLFSTANFTFNGLQNSRELMAITTDLTAIDRILAYGEELRFKIRN